MLKIHLCYMPVAGILPLKTEAFFAASRRPSAKMSGKSDQFGKDSIADKQGFFGQADGFSIVVQHT